MPRTKHTILLTYWRSQPAEDLRSLDQIRAAHAAGVYDASFERYQKAALAMEAVFDDGDPSALNAAVFAAMLNLKAHTLGRHRTVEVWVDGRLIPEIENLLPV